MTEFRVQLRRRNISEEDLIGDLKRVSTELSKSTVTASEYSSKGQFGVNTFLRRFKQWNLALQAAGLEAPNRQHIPDVELFENIADVWTRLGRQPLGRELEKTDRLSKFSLGTYESRFGSWNKALLAFADFINSEKTMTPPPKAHREVTTQKRTNRKINWRLRAQVLIRDNCICQMCGASPAKDPTVVLHADHIKPWSKGGETVIENLRTLCLKCNIGKSDMHAD
jgi:5-methylcytosine-specific restriction endonuclease McrA